MKIIETRMPDFMIEHAADWNEIKECPVHSHCVDISFRAFTIEELVERWNNFCANDYDESKPDRIPYVNQGNKYCPIAKTVCNDGMIFNGIDCAFTTEYGGCMADDVKEVFKFLTYEIPHNDKSIPVIVYVDGGSLTTYEQNC